MFATCSRPQRLPIADLCQTAALIDQLEAGREDRGGEALD